MSIFICHGDETVSHNSIVYEASTGRITGVFVASGPLPPQAKTGELEITGYVETIDYKYVHYVQNGVVISRPEMPISQTGNTLTVPTGTEFSVRGPASIDEVAQDGTLEFEFSEPGTYVVTLRKFPYLDAEVTLEG
jgi:hypothetical protein